MDDDQMAPLIDPEEYLRQQAFLILSRLQSGTEDVVRLDAALAAVAAERERIKAALIGMDDAVAGRHNYYAHAAVVLFGPNVDVTGPRLRGSGGQQGSTAQPPSSGD